MYTKEQNLEIEKVCRVFLTISKKIHILMWFGQTSWDMSIWTGISFDKDDNQMAPIVLRSGRDLCEEIIHNIAEDVLKEAGVSHDAFAECSEKEQEKIKDRLLPYMKQLPEYGPMMEELFWD